MLESLGRRIARFPFAMTLFVTLLLVLIKAGLHPIGPQWIEIVRDASNAFPKAFNYMSTSPLPIFIYEAIGGRNIVWWSVHLFLMCIFILLGIRVIQQRYKKTRHLAIVLFFSSPLMLVLLYFVGHYDLFTIAGAGIAVFAKRNQIRLFGVLIASLANPDQALVTSALLLLLYFVNRGSELRRLSLSYLGISVTVFLSVRIIVQDVGDAQRSSVILNELESVVRSSFGVWSLVPLSVIGITGIFIALNAKQVTGKYVPTLIILFGLPSVLSLLILDKTRVGVAVSAALFFFFGKEIMDRLEARFEAEPNPYFENLGLVSVLALFYPPLYFDIGGELRLPYKEFLMIIAG